MFIKSLNGIIQMNRGDSGEFSILLNKGTSIKPDYVTLDNENDRVYFGVMQSEDIFEHSLIKKVYSKEDIEGNSLFISLDTTDTEYLKSGTYFYEIKIKKYNDSNTLDYKVFTIIPKTKFIIME